MTEYEIAMLLLAASTFLLTFISFIFKWVMVLVKNNGKRQHKN